VTLGLSSDLGRSATAEAQDPSDRAAFAAATSPGQTLVNTALAGTSAATTPGVQADDCAGASLPLSLPEGATPTGASLVATDDAGRQPSTVDPTVAAGYPQLDSSGATLVGDGGACVSGLLPALADAPANTALAVTYLDPLGQLHTLIVPRIAVTVGNAVEDVNELVDALDQQLQAYLAAVTAYLQGLPGGIGNGSIPPGGGVGGGADVPDLPVPPSGQLPDLPGIPSVPGGIVGGGSGGGGSSGGGGGGGGGSGGVGGVAWTTCSAAASPDSLPGPGPG
jgi:hypothetical protein